MTLTSTLRNWFSVEARRTPLDPLPKELIDALNQETTRYPCSIEIRNDDHTPMDFVVQVLQTYLQMDKKLATKTMLEVHQKGRVRLLSTTWGNVTALQANIDRESKKRGHPLVCSAVKTD